MFRCNFANLSEREKMKKKKQLEILSNIFVLLFMFCNCNIVQSDLGRTFPLLGRSATDVNVSHLWIICLTYTKM